MAFARPLPARLCANASKEHEIILFLDKASLRNFSFIYLFDPSVAMADNLVLYWHKLLISFKKQG